MKDVIDAIAIAIASLIGFAGVVAACIILSLVLAGCATTPGPVSVLASPPKPARLAPECTRADPAWAELPDRDVTQSELARLWRTNRGRYRAVIASRRVCRASVAAWK